MKRILVLAVFQLSISGCIKTEAEVAPQVVIETRRCSYSTLDTYFLGTDPSVDFNVNDVAATSRITSSTCDGLAAGMIASGVMDNVSRVGNTVTFTNLGHSDTLSVSGSSLSWGPVSGCSDGVSVSGRLVSGVLNVSEQTISLSLSVELVENGCVSASPAPAPTVSPTSTPTSPSTPPAGDNSPYLIYFNSQAGDYIGQGQIRSYHTVDGTFSASKNYKNGVSVSMSGSSHWWYLDFSSGDGALLASGTLYENAERFPFASPGKPGLDVSGDGRGCNTLGGKFRVLDVEYGSGTTINRFVAEFEQHCENGAKALYGTVRFNAAPVMP